MLSSRKRSNLSFFIGATVLLGLPAHLNSNGGNARSPSRRILAVATIRQIPELVTIVVNGNTYSQNLGKMETGSRIRVYGSVNGRTVTADRIELISATHT